MKTAVALVMCGLAGALGDMGCDMALHGEAPQRMWAHRRAAWAIEDTEQDV